MLDTNVVVSGLIAPSSPPAALIDAWIAHRFELVASSALLSELERIVERPRVRRYFADADTATSIAATIRARAIVVEPKRAIIASRDPDDDRVLEAAVAGDAQYIVTGDADLLALGSFEGITILTPTAFLDVIGPAERVP